MFASLQLHGSHLAGFFLLSCCALLSACAHTPYTNRSQLLLISPNDEAQMGLAAFQEVLKNEKISHDIKANALVRQVGERIAQAANRPDFQWAFKVIDSNEKNAFCLPGGKIVVYTGLLPITQNEEGLAVIIAHEVAHAIARHGAERVSQNLLSQGIMAGAEVALARSGKTNPNLMSALGLGVQMGVLLPFSREHESEADRIGLILMAKAGYDPNSAIGLWERMKAVGGKKPPEFLSTHPADDTRIRQIKAWLPEAQSAFTPKNPPQNH